MNEQVRVGIIGCGTVTEAVHVPALATLPESFRLTHCFDPAPARAEAIAARTGAKATHLEELFESVDVVGVFSPPHLRTRHLVAACRAKPRAVFVDLPVGLTAAETMFASEVARETSTMVAVNALHLGDPAWQRAVVLRQRHDGNLAVARFMAALGPDETFIEAQTQPSAESSLDADAAYSGFAARAVVAGLHAPSNVATVLQYLSSVTIHDLPLVRALFGGVGVIDHVALFGGGLELFLSTTAGVPAHLTVYRHTLRRTVWRGDLVSADTHIQVDFAHPMLTMVASDLVVRDAYGSASQSNLKESGLRASWRALHSAIVKGDSVLYGLSHAAEDHQLIDEVARRIVSSILPSVAQEGEASRRTVSIFGAGVFAPIHLSAAVARGHVPRVVARSQESAQVRAALVGCATATYDAPEALSGVDAVIVATAPVAHATHALAAIRRGLPVLVEKPMTATVGQARELANEVARRGARFVYGENWAFRPAIRKAVEVARRQQLNSIQVNAAWAAPSWGDYLDVSHGGGVLFDSGAHVIELARLLLGRPRAERVSAELLAGPSGVDMEAHVEIEFAEERRARLHIMWGKALPSVYANGPDFDLQLSPDVTLEASGGSVSLPRATGVSAFLVDDGILAEHEALTGDGPLLASVEDGLAVMEIIAAAYLSAGMGRTTPLPFTGDENLTPHQLWVQARP